jgi:arylsulfatase A-like enzyme
MLIVFAVSVGVSASRTVEMQSQARPNVVLVMADDMGWGEVSYYDHPVLKTPNLDEMAASGLRFDRFYAGAPNCSPTRASVMTGRTNDRTGVLNHGYGMSLHERTIAQAFQQRDYATAHFGKWHLSGLRGPGAPVLASDPRNPGAFGFDEWLSVTNFFDLNPIMSRRGTFQEFQGDSSELIVAEAMEFIRRQSAGGRPFFAVIWYGTPHDPFRALEADKAGFAHLDPEAANHYGELVAMDRSIGTLRRGLRELGIAENTFLMFSSDNGGLNLTPTTVGHLRGFKNSVYEGGLRVPGIIEWPGTIKPRITSFPAATMDIFPTVVSVAGLARSSMLQPVDGMDLTPLFREELARRETPIGFRHTGRAALVDNNYKLVVPNVEARSFELYDVVKDPSETADLWPSEPAAGARMRGMFEAWNASVNNSQMGRDYASGIDDRSVLEPRNWMTAPEYAPYIQEWRLRPEFAGRLGGAGGRAGGRGGARGGQAPDGE